MFATLPNHVFWNRAARKYAASPVSDQAGLERTLARTAALLSPNDRVLEIGCGTGSMALSLARHVKHITATDASYAMIGIAREKAKIQNVFNVNFEVADAEDTVPGKAFDAVLAFNLLHLVEDLPATLNAAAQQLKPGGLLISKTACLGEASVFLRLAVRPLQLIGKAPHVSCFTARELELTLESSGFTVLEKGKHGTKKPDIRHFIAARKTETRHRRPNTWASGYMAMTRLLIPGLELAYQVARLFQ